MNIHRERGLLLNLLCQLAKILLPSSTEWVATLARPSQDMPPIQRFGMKDSVKYFIAP